MTECREGREKTKMDSRFRGNDRMQRRKREDKDGFPLSRE
jgi:hypothetical protein